MKITDFFIKENERAKESSEIISLPSYIINILSNYKSDHIVGDILVKINNEIPERFSNDKDSPIVRYIVLYKDEKEMLWGRRICKSGDLSKNIICFSTCPDAEYLRDAVLNIVFNQQDLSAEERIEKIIQKYKHEI